MWNAVGLQQSLMKQYKFDLETEYDIFSLSPKKKKVNHLTLAQRLGFEEKPEIPLTEEQWREAEEKAKARKDFHYPCPICREPFGLAPQVILSCTHVFHRVWKFQCSYKIGMPKIL